MADGSASGGVALDPSLLAVLACPACHGPLTPRADGLACAACALVYPVRDGIPVLLADDALPADAAPDGER